METGGEPGHLYPERTRTENQHFYFFYDKHHGRGGPDVAQWAEDMSELEEFEIFNQADELELADRRGNLYGLRLGEDREILELGTLQQQVAKFPRAYPGQPWHGFPLGPLKAARQPHPPIRQMPKEALRKMEEEGLLDEVQRKRLERGKHV